MERLICIAVITILCTFSTLANEEVTIYTYHLKPPFIVDENSQQGLYYDLADFLNSKDLAFRFRTEYIPKKRIDLLISLQQLDGILVGVNPAWFNDRAESKYLWTDPLLVDQDEVVSLKQSPIEFTTPKSLTNSKLAGVRGYYYFGIDELVRQGLIFRDDTIGEREVLKMIAKQRVDIGIVSRSTLNFLKSKEALPDIYHLSDIPHDTYQRRVLVPKNYQTVFKAISPIISELENDENWQRLINKYQ